MKRRKDIASLLRQMERPVSNSTTMGVASSIGGDGKTINGQNTADSEVRDLRIALPYGISSSGLDGIRIQIITNDNQNNVAVGVIDQNRPPVKSGCLILYDKSGNRIVMNGDGTIKLYGDIYFNDIPMSDILDRLQALEDNDMSDIVNRLQALEDKDKIVSAYKQS